MYRALRAMAGRGEIDVVVAEDGQRLYRACGSIGHHHHLICRRCGRTAEIPGAALERWVAAASRQHGFTNVTHITELFGTCPRCSPPAAPGNGGYRHSANMTLAADEGGDGKGIGG